MLEREDIPSKTEKAKINHFVVLGDSLSDMGMLWDKEFLGIFPALRMWSGLVGTSPKHQFTNGDVWEIHLAKKLAENFLKKKNEKPDRIDDNLIEWEHRDLIRSFAEGGVTAHHYTFTPITSFLKFVSRFILDSLRNMREYLLKHDKTKDYDKLHKAHSLVIDWTGANDLVTVNDAPTGKEVQVAIESRIKNVRKLLKDGYKHFVLFDLPDLSLTPRYQNTMSEDAKKNAQACINKFNTMLAEEVDKLQKRYPQCGFSVYKVSDGFRDIYEHPDQYGLDKNKLKESLKYAADYPKNVQDGKVIPSNHYMFWDDIHPTNRTHDLLAEKVKEKIVSQYEVCEPGTLRKDKPADLKISKEDLIKIFIEAYDGKLAKDGKYFVGLFGSPKLYNQYGKNFTLDELFNRAFSQDCRIGMRTFRVMCSLGWINTKGELLAENVPALREAYRNTDSYQSKFEPASSKAAF